MVFYPQQSSGKGEISKFNSALLKMARLDELQKTINMVDRNLTAWNVEHGVYNFELKIASLNSLFQESGSKLSTGERNDGTAFRIAIEKFIDENPVYETRKSKVYPYNDSVKFNPAVWKVVKKWLFDWETKVRNYISKHGMDTPSADDPALAVFQS